MSDKSPFTCGHIRGRSSCSEDVPSLLRGHYDVLVSVSSWDSRCCCIIQAETLHAEHAILVLFDARDKKGLRDKHDALLKDFCLSHSTNCQSISCSSVDLDGTWGQLSAQLEAIAKSTGKPISVLLDMSTCPRYYALAVLGKSLGEHLAHRLTMLYAEGQYPKNKGKEICFTGRRWSTVPVPFFYGLYRPGNGRLYVVSVGFEGNKTLRAVSRADPDRVAILFPKPGIIEEYVTKARRVNRELIESYNVVRTAIIESHVADAVGAWRSLSKAAPERADENVYYMCTGSKPHALALGLRALSLKRPAVLYNVPDEHPVVETVPFGRYWKYEIEDLTAVGYRG